MMRWVVSAAIYGLLTYAALAQGGMMPGPGTPHSAGGAATTTWNPADTNVNVLLSGGNLTATCGPSASGNIGVRAIASHSTGKFYYEVTSSAGAIGNWIPGVANLSESLSNFTGSSPNSIGWNSDGNVYNNGSPVAGSPFQSFGSIGQPFTLGIAIDLGNAIWLRANGGNWNNSGTANPATNTGGISLSGLATGPYLPMWSCGSATAANTANFGATSYGTAAPAGFGNW